MIRTRNETLGTCLWRLWSLWNLWSLWSLCSEEAGEKKKSKAPANATATPLAWSTTSCLHFVALRGFWIADHVVKTLELRLGFCLRGPASNGGDLRSASALCRFGAGKGGMLAFFF